MSSFASKGDVLDLILPGLSARQAAELRRLVHFLRLCAHDARSVRAASSALVLPRAQAELQDLERSARCAALEKLLALYASAACSAGRALHFEQPAEAPQVVWAELAQLGGPARSELGPPEPREAASNFARRCFAALEQELGAQERVELWRARLCALEQGPGPGEAALRALLRCEGLSTRTRVAAVRGVAECLLERHQLRALAALVKEEPEAVAIDARLAFLAGWSALCLGEEARGEEYLRGALEHSGPTPLALRELAEARPAWARWLSPAQPTPEAFEAPGYWKLLATEPARRTGAMRTELGAAVCALVALGPGDSAAALLFEAAPALRAAACARFEERDGALRSSGEPEQRLAVTQRSLRVLAEGREAPRGALGGSSIRALTLAPVLDDRGRLAGWLQVESEHLCLPAAVQLETLARLLRPAVLEHRRQAFAAERDCGRVREAALGKQRPAGRAETWIGAHYQASAAVLLEAQRLLGFKLARRRCFGLLAAGEELELAASWGGALADHASLRGGAALAERARQSGQACMADHCSSAEAWHAGAASCLVLPIASPTRVEGLLVFESLRRADFRGPRLEQHCARLAGLSEALRLARFADWHRQSSGHEVVLLAGEHGLGGQLCASQAACDSRAPLWVHGPGGVGKHIAARWLHYESARRRQPLLSFDPGHRPAVEAWRMLVGEDGHGGLWAEALLGSLVLGSLEHWPLALQRLLAERLGEALTEGQAPRVLALAPWPVGQAREEGRLDRALLAALGRLELRVPPLCERRDEIAPLARLFAREAATREGRPQIEFDDSALAVLWRQPWAGNARELEELCYKLALHYPGRTLGRRELCELAARQQKPLLERLPTRHPARADLQSALRVTRKHTGALNKLRAARYLGWDPDTLVERLLESGWTPDGGDPRWRSAPELAPSG